MRVFFLLALIAVCAGCNRQEAPPAPPDAAAIKASGAEHTSTAATELGNKLWQTAAENWHSNQQLCISQQQAVSTLLQSPSAQTLMDAQDTWLKLQEGMQKNSAATAFAIVSPDLFAELDALLQLTESQPIAPGFIDAIVGYPYSGLVHDFSTPINRTTLLEQHQLTDDSEALLGMYVVEFLLFGEKGERQATDFVAELQGTDSLSAQQRPHNRRRNLLKLTSTLLCDHIKAVKTNWIDTSSNISRAYFTLPPLGQLMLWREAIAARLEDAAPQDCAFAKQQCQNTTATLIGLNRYLEATLQAEAELSTSDKTLYDSIELQLANIKSGAPLDTEASLEVLRKNPGKHRL